MTPSVSMKKIYGSSSPWDAFLIHDATGTKPLEAFIAGSYVSIPSQLSYDI